MLDAAGCDVVLVETVGVGQSEVEIAGLADTTLVLLAPGVGDGIQAAKAGILEIGDIYVVNKADRDGADQLRRDLRVDDRARRPDARAPGGRRSSRPWRTAARASTSWSRRSTGTSPGWSESGELERRRTRRARDEIEAIAVTALRRRWDDVHARVELDDLAAAVVAGASPTRTPPPTRCWRTSSRSRRSRSRFRHRGPPAWESPVDVPKVGR